MNAINMNTMVRKLELLSESKLIEINDFVDFLISKKEKENTEKFFSKISNTSFNKLWNNKDDEVYDEL